MEDDDHKVYIVKDSTVSEKIEKIEILTPNPSNRLQKRNISR